MDKSTSKFEKIGEYIPILVAGIAVIFTIFIQLHFLEEITLIENILGSLVVFGVIYIIFRCIIDQSSIIRERSISLM